MARKRISPETIARIQEEVAKGKARDQVAYELGVGYLTVQKNSVGLGNPPRLPIPEETRRKIREDLWGGMPNVRIAKKYGVSTRAVSRIAKGLCDDSHGLCIRGSTLAALKVILDKGYVTSLRQRQAKLLTTVFPQITTSRINGYHVLYFKSRAEEAAAAFAGDLHGKVISYSELDNIRKAFGIDKKRERAKKRSFGEKR